MKTISKYNFFSLTVLDKFSLHWMLLHKITFHSAQWFFASKMKNRCFFPCALNTSMFDIRIKMMVLYSGQKLFAKLPCGDGAVQKPSCRHADKTSHLITPQSCDNRVNSYLNDLKTFLSVSRTQINRYYNSWNKRISSFSSTKNKNDTHDTTENGLRTYVNHINHRIGK